MATILSAQGEVLDTICTRTYGDESGYVEALLEANPGLAAKGPILPMGTKVRLPEIKKPDETPVVTLWD